MLRINFLVTMMLAFLVWRPAQIAAEDNVRPLFEFSSDNAMQGWQIVNDGVMGGRSSSRVTQTNDGRMQFEGTISLANNGGFASVRSKPKQLGLKGDDVFVIRLKADGRVYTFNLYTPDRRTAFSFQRDFRTLDDQWVEVRLPLREFVAHSFGRPLPGEKLDPASVQSVGILLGDKKSGPFQILVDNIGVTSEP